VPAPFLSFVVSFFLSPRTFHTAPQNGANYLRKGLQLTNLQKHRYRRNVHTTDHITVHITDHYITAVHIMHSTTETMH
jgi:hypothetical protein